MKRIGHTEQGNILVELNPQEYEGFVALIAVAKGKALPYQDYHGDKAIDENVVSFLSAVSEWVVVKDKANQLHNLARDIEIAIKRGDIQP